MNDLALVPDRIATALPDAAAEALKWLCRVAVKDGVSLYLVGGAVRDHLLIEPDTRTPGPILDLDLAADGDVSPLHVVLAELGDGPPTVHDRFGTASVRLAAQPDAHIDLARTRAERYPAPGALPIVEPAPILADLRRRDFTINSAAFVLTGADAGTLIDPYGARDDRRRRIIRTLHPSSFSDDPTRLIRAARYAGRLDARLSRGTAGEVKSQNHHLRALTPGRFGDAWRLLLNEADPPAALGAARRMRLPQARLSGWSVAPRVVRAGTSPLDFWAAVGLTEASRTMLNTLPESISLTRGERAALDGGVRLRSQRQVLATTRRASARAGMLAGTNDSALAVAQRIWRGGAARALSEYLERRGEVMSPIPATRLLELGVPAGRPVGAWLRWLSDAVWDYAIDPQDRAAIARAEQRIASNPQFPPRNPPKPPAATAERRA